MSDKIPIPSHPKFIDLTGRPVHHWTVIGYRGKTRGCHRWLCKCQCGTEREYTGDQVSKNNLRQHCGCIVAQWNKNHLTVEQLRDASEIIECPPQINNRTGQKNGILTIVGLAGRCADRTYWWAHCECGNLHMLEGYASSITVSCGCQQSEQISASTTTHGLTKTTEDLRVLMRWHSMIARCYKPKTQNYERYGGRGIKVCDRWRESPLNFLADMGHPPTPNYTLERKNNDGNYEPGNCVWATRKVQQRNTRRNINVTIDGRTQCLKAWCEELGIKYSLVQCRVTNYGWEPLLALTTPAMNRGRRAA